MSLLIRGGDFNCGERAEAVACQVAPRCSSCGGGEDSKMTGETLKNGALQCPSTGRGLKHGLHRESLLSYIAPHTRSGDFNLIFSAQKSGREVAPHTGAGILTLMPRRNLCLTMSRPVWGVGISTVTATAVDSSSASLPTRRAGIST